MGAWAWDKVAEHLIAAGRRPIALTLPGLDSDDAERAFRALEDQAAAIEEAAVAEGRPVVIVARSGANAPARTAVE